MADKRQERRDINLPQGSLGKNASAANEKAYMRRDRVIHDLVLPKTNSTYLSDGSTIAGHVAFMRKDFGTFHQCEIMRRLVCSILHRLGIRNKEFCEYAQPPTPAELNELPLVNGIPAPVWLHKRAARRVKYLKAKASKLESSKGPIPDGLGTNLHVYIWQEIEYATERYLHVTKKETRKSRDEFGSPDSKRQKFGPADGDGTDSSIERKNFPTKSMISKADEQVQGTSLRGKGDGESVAKVSPLASTEQANRAEIAERLKAIRRLEQMLPQRDDTDEELLRMRMYMIRKLKGILDDFGKATSGKDGTGVGKQSSKNIAFPASHEIPSAVQISSENAKTMLTTSGPEGLTSTNATSNLPSSSKILGGAPASSKAVDGHSSSQTPSGPAPRGARLLYMEEQRDACTGSGHLPEAFWCYGFLKRASNE